MGSPIRNNTGADRAVSGAPVDAGTTADGAGANRGAPATSRGAFRDLRQGDLSPLPTSVPSNNASARDVPNARARAVGSGRRGSAAVAEDTTAVDPRSVTAFLRAFPSSEVLAGALPELAAMTIPADTDAADFRRVLADVLGRDRCARLTEAYEPEAILCGLRELAARARRAETASEPRQDKRKVAEAKEVRAAEAEKVKSAPALKRHSVNVAHFLENREVDPAASRGRGPLGFRGEPDKRFAAVRRDRFAALGLLTQYDVRKLPGYYGQVSDLVAVIRRSMPKIWNVLEDRIAEDDCTGLYKLRRTPIVKERFLEITEEIFGVKEEARVFFRQLLSLEAVHRTLQLIESCRKYLQDEESISDGGDDEEDDDCGYDIFEFMAATVLRKILLSVLITEKANFQSGNKNEFEKLIIETFIVLCKTTDFAEAEAQLEWRARRAWPDVPRLDAADVDSDPESVRTARKVISSGKFAIVPTEELPLHKKMIYYYLIHYDPLIRDPSDPRTDDVLDHISSSMNYLIFFLTFPSQH